MVKKRKEGSRSTEERKEILQQRQGEEDQGQEEQLSCEADQTEGPAPAFEDMDEEKAHLQSLLAQEKEEKEALLKRLQRAQADFSNYKKRVEKDRFQDKVRTQQEFMEALLPVLDNFERALESQEDVEGQGFKKGVEMIFKQFLAVLQGLGLEEVKAQDKPFNPQYHEAIEPVECCHIPPDTVVEVVQKGYKMGDCLLRPALVKVSKGGDDNE